MIGDILMAGAVAPTSFGVDEKHRVFVLDQKGNLVPPEITGPLADEVREAIRRTKAGDERRTKK